MLQPISPLRQRRLLARNVLAKLGKLAFKPVSSAKWVNAKRRLDGSILVQIEHDNVKGVTPEMMKWWFENLGRTTTWNGEDFSGPEISFYHLWHHRDHIAITPLTDKPNGEKNHGFAVGAMSKIDEQFNDYKDRIGQTMMTIALDEKEFTFNIKLGKLTLGHIAHYYAPAEDGISFYAETKIGSDIPVLKYLINWLFIPFVYNLTSAENWIRHNIEETGRTEDIVPLLYAHRERFK